MQSEKSEKQCNKIAIDPIKTILQPFSKLKKTKQKTKYKSSQPRFRSTTY